MGENRTDNHIFRQLSADMREGLKDIYRQISTVSDENAAVCNSANDLFAEAGEQLDEVVKATESAAMSIMEIVEKQLELQAESESIIGRGKEITPDEFVRLHAINASLSSDLTSLLTILSFQDIAGQRIKKVMGALKEIEQRVLELYISSGLIMEGAKKTPEKDSATLREEAQKAVENFCEQRKSQGASRLKGPDKNGCSQGAIDDMLAQLGL